MGIILPDELHIALRERHRKERDGRVKARIKAVLLRDKGYSYEEIAEVLFLSDEGARRQVEDYLREKRLAPENGGLSRIWIRSKRRSCWRIWNQRPTFMCARLRPMSRWRSA